MLCHLHARALRACDQNHRELPDAHVERRTRRRNGPTHHRRRPAYVRQDSKVPGRAHLAALALPSRPASQ